MHEKRGETSRSHQGHMTAYVDDQLTGIIEGWYATLFGEDYAHMT